MPIVAKVLNGEALSVDDKPQSNFPGFKNANTLLIEYSDMPDNVQKDTIAVLPICGPIMKYDFCWEPGTQTRAKQLEQIDANDNYGGVIIWIDSPGGEALATELLHDAILNFSKPIYCYINGMCCSAAMWIASACDKIYAATNTCLIGSIGTMYTMADCREMYEREGVKLHEIYATKSTDKNKIFRDALDENYEPIRSKLLDPLNEIFLNSVIANRKGLDQEKTSTGETFFTEDAIQFGLIDAREDFNIVLTKITKMFGLNNKFKKLDRFANKDLSAKEKSEVKKILVAAGIRFDDDTPAATAATETNVVKSKLYEATEGKNIYVYMEEGEDPTGKRCVYADETGNPTEENVSDGAHPCKDGSTLETETREDGMSYVKSWTPATASPAPVETPAPAPVAPNQSTPAPAASGVTLEAIETLLNNKIGGLKTEILNAVDEKVNGVKNEIVVGKKPSNGTNTLGGSSAAVVTESAFDRRRKEIREKNSNQNNK